MLPRRVSAEGVFFLAGSVVAAASSPYTNRNYVELPLVSDHKLEGSSVVNVYLNSWNCPPWTNLLKSTIVIGLGLLNTADRSYAPFDFREPFYPADQGDQTTDGLR